MKATILWFLASVATLVVFVAIWGAVAKAGLISPVFFPTPEKVGNALLRGFSSGKLALSTMETIKRVLLGWLLASIIAVIVGGAIGMSPVLRSYFQPLLEIIRPLPASATIPIFTILFGLNDTMVLGVIAFGAGWPTLLSAIHGLASVEKRLYEVSAALGLSKLQVFLKIALPSAFPSILAGMKLSLTVTLILAVVCEMLASATGVGQWIANAGRQFRADNLFAGVVVLGIIGLASSALLAALQSWLLRWKTV